MWLGGQVTQKQVTIPHGTTALLSKNILVSHHCLCIWSLSKMSLKLDKENGACIIKYKECFASAING